MSRADLLALTPQALAQLSNMGLVKRAQRELGEGLVPTLSEDEEGTVTGTFSDGIVAKLPIGTTLKACPCTCGATSVCRHRIAVALAYGPWHAALATEVPKVGSSSSTEAPSTEAIPASDAPSRSDEAPSTPWSPGELSDEVLGRALGDRVLERARRTARRGLVATVEREETPTARLPSCTVRFLVPRDVAYARCDCVDAGGACEHLALAVWAFREADAVAPEGLRAIVSFGGGEALAASCTAALDDALALAHALLARGVEAFQPAPTRFAQVKSRLEREGVVWIHDLVADLEIALEGYHARSALHGTREVAALLVELRARTRAGIAVDCELPARFVLGQGEASETALDHVRLVSLGARLRADARTRFADVFLADPDTATVLVLQKRWDYDEKTEPENGYDLANRRVSTQVSLRSLAHGQLVSKVVRRRANRGIEIGTSRAAQSSVTPQLGDYGSLPSPLLVADLSVHTSRTFLLPPRMLAPRVLAEDVHVVVVSAVRDVGYSAAEQRLVARLADAAGNEFTLVLGHRRVAPHAIDATLGALDASPRFVSGSLVSTPSGFELTPFSVSAKTLVVPDLAGPTKVAPAPVLTPRRTSTPFDDALTAAESALEELCSVGLESAPKRVLARAESAREKLEATCFSDLAARVGRTLHERGEGRISNAAEAWLDSALRVALTREALTK